MSSLCDYSDTYILNGGTITIDGAGADDHAKREDGRKKGVIFKNCASFTDCISEINNTETDNAKDKDVVMPIYNLIEYSDKYSKASGSLFQYYRDEPNDNAANPKSFRPKMKIRGNTPDADNKKTLKQQFH